MTDHKPLSEGEMKRYRHKKRGTVYLSLGTARMQASNKAVHEGDTVEVYRAESDGVLWVRPLKEFHDGRFEEIALAPKPLDGEAGIDNDMLEHLESVVRACSKERRKDAALQEAVEVAVGTVKDIRAFLSLPTQTCEATERKIEAAFAEGVGGLALGISGAYVVSVLAKAGLCIVKSAP